MSRKWELEADSSKNADIAMAIFIGKNIPVAVYEPEEHGFLPQNIMENNKHSIESEKLHKIIGTIKNVTVE